MIINKKILIDFLIKNIILNLILNLQIGKYFSETHFFSCTGNFFTRDLS